MQEGSLGIDDPPPRIEHVLDQLLGSTIFNTLDLKAGYWHVEMVEECKPYTAFTCGPLGFYEYETMPFGATNAPATFQRLIDNCLGDLNMNWCIVYLDDIIIFSQDAASHIERLEAVFRKLAKAGLKLKPSKCEFFKKRIKYLGHIVSEEGVSTDPKKVEAVLNWPVPKTVYDVRAFLGFVGYYRRFIKGFSKVALPLRKLLIGLESRGKKAAKHTPVDWGEEEQTAFDTLKSLCCKAPILAYSNYKLPFILHTDSSLEGLGAVLYQVLNGVKRVIVYTSRSVNKTEMNYPVQKLEFLALKWAITDKFHDYLYGGNTFDVYVMCATWEDDVSPQRRYASEDVNLYSRKSAHGHQPKGGQSCADGTWSIRGYAHGMCRVFRGASTHSGQTTTNQIQLKEVGSRNGDASARQS